MSRPISSFSFTSLSLDAAYRQPLFVQLYEYLCQAIGDGRIKPGTRLPATRVVAADLGISRTTVVSAYEQLVAEGYADSRQGAGCFVLSSGGSQEGERPPVKKAVTAGHLDASRPFTHPGYPDSKLFPTRDWARCVARCARLEPEAMMSASSRLGDSLLRAAIGRYLAEWRGLEVDPGRILITAGSVDALELCIRTLANRGDHVGLENPCYRPLRAIVTNLGLNVDWLEVDSGGAMLPDDNSTLAVLTPSQQFPLGGAMQVKRRLEFLNWANHAGGWIIEDDYDSEFRYAGRPIPALASLDQNERTIYVGTFSKVFSVNLRLGYLVMPERLIDRFESTLGRYGGKAALPFQRPLARFMEDDSLYRHIRRARRIYAERRRLLLSLVQSELAAYLYCIDHQAGMHLTVFFKEEMDDKNIAAQLREQGVDAPPLSAYYCSEEATPGLLLGFCAHTTDQITRNVGILAGVLASARGLT